MPARASLRTIRREYRASRMRVSICDTGSGIESKYAKRIFEPFFTTKETKGTGLGLWISRGIIQKYEGEVRFRSIRFASGNTTCFSVFILRLAAPEDIDGSARHEPVLNQSAQVL